MPPTPAPSPAESPTKNPTGPSIGSPSRPAIPPDVPIGVPRPAVGAVLTPSPTPRRTPAAIPAGDDHAGIAQTLTSATLDIAVPINTKLAHIERNVVEAIEFARVHPSDHRQDLVSVVKNIGALLTERLKLKGQLGTQAELAPVEYDTHLAVRSIARFRDGAGLRVEYSRRIKALRAEVARIGQLTQDAMEYPAHNHSPVEREKMLKARLEALLKLKGELAARLSNLDKIGDAGRVFLLADAIKAAGGESKLSEQLGPMLPDTADVERSALLNGQANTLTGQLVSLDPDSARSANLRGELGRVKAQQTTIAERSLVTRRKAAAMLIVGAAGGSLDELGSLAPFASQLSPAFGLAVEQARGDERDLIATIAEIIATDQQRIAREAERKAALARSQQPS